MSIDTEINRPSPTVFRRCFIKRRSASTGLYESSWFEVTEFVKNWGSIKRTIDDLRLNRFTHSGITLTVRNDTGAFNREDNENSLWSGYLTRYRTLVKIEAGFQDEDGIEYPTDPTLGIFIISDEVPISAGDVDAVIQCRSLVSVFDEVRARDVAGLGSTQTAFDIIAKMRDHTDGAGTPVFRQFITSTAWSIQSTTTLYNLATSTSLEGVTAWELMTKIAECEGFILMINRTGGFEFRDRGTRTSTSAFTFNGLGFRKMNIIKLDDFREAINKFYNDFRLQWAEGDTTTSFVQAGTTTVVNASNSAWKYGNHRYDFQNLFFATSTSAQSVVNNLYTQFNEVRDECRLTTRFVPHLEISDRVSLNYRSFTIDNAALWDLSLWDEFVWDGTGDLFDLNEEPFKILSVSVDLNRFISTFNLREI